MHLFCLSFDDESVNATSEGDAEESVCHHDATDMNAEQGGGEHGHEMGDFRVHLPEVADQQEKARKQKSKGEDDVKSPIDKQGGKHNHPCHQNHRFVAIAHGNITTDNPAQTEAERKGQKG